MGFHIDLEYCCGNLESLGLFDQDVIQIEKCCTGMDEAAECHDDDHIIKEMEHKDFNSSSSLRLLSSPQFEVPGFSLAYLEDEENEVPLILEEHWLGAPPSILYQQFLC